MTLAAEGVRDDGALLLTDPPAAIIAMPGGARVMSRDAALARGGWTKAPAGAPMPVLAPDVLADLGELRARLVATDAMMAPSAGGDAARSFNPSQPRADDGKWSRWRGISSNVMEGLESLYGPVLDVDSFHVGDGDEPGDSFDGWVSLHSDGTIAITHEPAEPGDGPVEVLDSVGTPQAYWHSLVDDLNNAADAMEDNDEFGVYSEEKSADGLEYSVITDGPADPANEGAIERIDVINFETGLGAGWGFGNPDDARTFADRIEWLLERHEAYEDGEYDEDDGSDDDVEDGAEGGAGAGTLARAARILGDTETADRDADEHEAARAAYEGWDETRLAEPVELTDDEIRALLADAPEELRAKGDGNSLKTYWTKGKGLAKWAKSRHPWTALYHHLAKHLDPERAKRVAAQWFHSVFHVWPGSDRHRVAMGYKPRGKKIGPG